MLMKFKDDPCVVRCLDAFEDLEYELKIIVMEYCPIESLRNYLLERRYIWEDEAKVILKQILICIARLHSCDLWHRDIKP